MINCNKTLQCKRGIAMSETTVKKKFSIGLLFIQAASIILGWTLLTIANLIPEVIGMPVVIAIRNYDPNAKIIDQSFDPGYFREYITRDGNLVNGGYLIHNDNGAWFWMKEEMIQLQPEKNCTLTLNGNLEKPPVFCDNRYFISVGYTNYVGLGKAGKTSISFLEHNWVIDPLSTDDWRMDVYNILVRSENERIDTKEMSTLVGYTYTLDLLGWGGQTAYFYYFDDDAKAAYMGKPQQQKIVLVPYSADGKGQEIQIPARMPNKITLCGRHLAYVENGVLKTYNLDTKEIKTISDKGQTVQHLNFIGKDGRHILVWISQDGLHTADLDYANTNFVSGDWLSDYWGLYIWDEDIFLLRNDSGYQSWKYTF